MTPPAPLQLPTADEALGWVEARTADGLARAREVVEGLKAAGSSGSLDALDVLRRWDEVTLAMSNVGALASLLSNVHPDEAVRTACEDAEVEVDKLVHRAAAGQRSLRRVRRRRRDGARPGRDPPARQDAPGPSRAPASTVTTRPARGWPGSTSGSPLWTRSSAATSVTTSATSRSPPTGWPGSRRTGWTSTRSTTTVWCRCAPTTPTRPDADVRARRRDPGRELVAGVPRSAGARRTTLCSRRCSTCVTSWPASSATTTGRRTTPR